MSAYDPYNSAAQLDRSWQKLTGESAAATHDAAGQALLGFCGAMFFPGLGHVLAGARKRGLWWMNAIAIPCVAALVVCQQPRYVAWAIVALAIATLLHIVQMFD